MNEILNDKMLQEIFSALEKGETFNHSDGNTTLSVSPNGMSLQFKSITKKTNKDKEVSDFLNFCDNLHDDLFTEVCETFEDAELDKLQNDLDTDNYRNTIKVFTTRVGEVANNRLTEIINDADAEICRQEKVIKNADNLRRYSIGNPIKLYSIKFGEYLKKVSTEAPPRMTCVLCKSGMYQSAAILAKREHANAIVDGSSIGQVASQTLSNLEATRYHCMMPIFSPLIAMDKIEIEAIAKNINTYETSIIPDGGCTAVPKYPETHADLELVKEIVEKINQKECLEKIAESITRIDF
jgi:hypothetical protein